MGLVKTLDIPMHILNFFNFHESLELLDYIIVGIFGLVTRLGFRGIVEEIFGDNYATMGGEDPTEGSSSGSKIGDVEANAEAGAEANVGADGDADTDSEAETGSTDTSAENLSEKAKGKQKEGSGYDDKQLESSPENVSETQGQPSLGVDTQNQEANRNLSTNYSAGKQRAERYTKVYDKLANSLADELKNLYVSIQNAKTAEDSKKFNDMFDATMDQMQMVSAEAAKELKKSLYEETSNSTVAKRDIDAVEKENKEEGGPSKRK